MVSLNCAVDRTDGHTNDHVDGNAYKHADEMRIGTQIDMGLNKSAVTQPIDAAIARMSWST